MSLAVFFISKEFANDYLTTFIIIILGGFIYLLTVALLFKDKLVFAIKGEHVVS
jgi:hypothetical protein